MMEPSHQDERIGRRPIRRDLFCYTSHDDLGWVRWLKRIRPATLMAIVSYVGFMLVRIRPACSLVSSI